MKDCHKSRLSAGTSSFVKDDLFEGEIPNRIIFGMVKNNAYSGTFTKKTFFFEHFEMNFINVTVSGDPLNSQPLKPSFNGDKTYFSNFLSPFTWMGTFKSDGGISLTRNDYDGGYCLSVFNFVPDPRQVGSSLIKGGNLRLEIQFFAGLTEPISLIIYGEFSSLLEVDQTCSIILK